MIFNREQINQRYRECLRCLYSERLAERDYNNQAYTVDPPKYSFPVEDVRLIYVYHVEKGHGTWFHLVDDTIWNEYDEWQADATKDDFI